MKSLSNEPISSLITDPVVPFLKWAGGKRWLAPAVSNLISATSGRYFEPFLGSGAVFFQIPSRESYLNDINVELINTYQAIKVDHRAVKKHLAYHNRRHDHNYYYQIRNYAPRCMFRRAARFIYLNRTCWNGLYRVNLNGDFNVPIGSKISALLPSDDWEKTAELLMSAKLSSADFEVIIDQAENGDVVFADPPYTVKHNHNGFIKYNESLFSWEDQIRLSNALLRAEKRGAKIILTNADHESVKALYQDKFHLYSAERNSLLSADPKYRGKFMELIVLSTNILPPHHHSPIEDR